MGGDCYIVLDLTDAGYNIDDDGTCRLSATSSVSDSSVIDDYLGTHRLIWWANPNDPATCRSLTVDGLSRSCIRGDSGNV